MSFSAHVSRPSSWICEDYVVYETRLRAGVRCCPNTARSFSGNGSECICDLFAWRCGMVSEAAPLKGAINHAWAPKEDAPLPDDDMVEPVAMVEEDELDDDEEEVHGSPPSAANKAALPDAPATSAVGADDVVMSKLAGLLVFGTASRFVRVRSTRIRRPHARNKFVALGLAIQKKVVNKSNVSGTARIQERIHCSSGTARNPTSPKCLQFFPCGWYHHASISFLSGLEIKLHHFQAAFDTLLFPLIQHF